MRSLETIDTRSIEEMVYQERGKTTSKKVQTGCPVRAFRGRKGQF